MYTKRITVLTPTYNRAHLIMNLYSSLREQKFTNFEWLVIDDGSSDETNALFSDIIENETRFTVRYHYKENGGKHTAVNIGLDLAEGEIFFVVDSDDTLTPDALLKLDLWFKEIANSPAIQGVVANKGHSFNYTVNNLFNSQHLDKTLLEMKTYKENDKLVIDGERAIAFYTDFHKNYKYPVFENEKFVTEAVVYNRMANDGFLMRFYNDIIWIFEYQNDGLTKQGANLFINNPYGYALYLRENAKFTHKSLLYKAKMYYTFTCDLSSKYTIKQIANFIGAPIIIISSLFAIHKLKHFFKTKIGK